MDINNKRFDLDYKLNDNESKCYPGQRRPKLKVNKGNLNINDIYSEYDFISKPSTTEQNISFNNKKEYVNKELSKDNCKSNNLAETKIKLKKYKKNKNKDNNRNTVNYIKNINSLIITKESHIDKMKKSTRNFSSNKEIKCKNNFKKNDKLIQHLIGHSQINIKNKINSQKTTKKIKGFKLKYNHYPSTQKSIVNNNKTYSPKKNYTSRSSNSGKITLFHIFDKKNINKTKYYKIPQKYIWFSKINENIYVKKHKNNNTDILMLKNKNIYSNNKLNNEHKKFKKKINNLKIDFFLKNIINTDKSNKKEKSKKLGKIKSLNYVSKKDINDII